jgi:hypothetical protein
MNNISSEKKPEIITDKSGNSFVLEGNIRSEKNKAMQELTECVKIASEALKDLGISFEEFNNRIKKASN